MKIRLLEREDDRNEFSSGDEDLDRFFRRFAGQNHFKHRIARTYVAVDEEGIVGYASVAAGHLETDALRTSILRKLPNYPLPVLRLGRLAVDERQHGKGVGSSLVAFVIELASTISESVGCVGVVVDAKASAVPFYARFGFSPAGMPIEGEARTLQPAPTMMFLALSQALRAGR